MVAHQGCKPLSNDARDGVFEDAPTMARFWAILMWGRSRWHCAIFFSKDGHARFERRLSERPCCSGPMAHDRRAIGPLRVRMNSI